VAVYSAEFPVVGAFVSPIALETKMVSGISRISPQFMQPSICRGISQLPSFFWSVVPARRATVVARSSSQAVNACVQHWGADPDAPVNSSRLTHRRRCKDKNQSVPPFAICLAGNYNYGYQTILNAVWCSVGWLLDTVLCTLAALRSGMGQRAVLRHLFSASYSSRMVNVSKKYTEVRGCAC
jgi:hypothetical protein